MALKFFRANGPAVTISGAKLATLALATAAVMAFGLPASDANAAPKKKHRVERSGPANYSYRSGPRTRVYITRRSWLDAGTEVLPGERKFMDYAIPPGQSFANQNLNRPLDRQPLNPPSDLGGYPERIPLY